MSYEALWYASRPYPPHMRRLTRLPPLQQLGLAFTFAIDLNYGDAGNRTSGKVTSTGEDTWYWPHPLSETGWWLLPQRTYNLALRAIDYAQDRSYWTRWRHGAPGERPDFVVLRRLERRAYAAAERVARVGGAVPEFARPKAKWSWRPEPRGKRGRPAAPIEDPEIVAARRTRIAALRYKHCDRDGKMMHKPNPRHQISYRWSAEGHDALCSCGWYAREGSRALLRQAVRLHRPEA